MVNKPVAVFQGYNIYLGANKNYYANVQKGGKWIRISGTWLADVKAGITKVHNQLCK